MSETNPFTRARLATDAKEYVGIEVPDLDIPPVREVLQDIVDIFNRGTTSDGWDISILDRVAEYLEGYGYPVIDSDDLEG
jgi:hypothetical protein